MSEAANSNPLKERKLKLNADPLDGAQQRNGRSMSPTLTVAVVDNQPRFTVYTNVEGDKQNGKIEGNMDAYTFGAVMETIRRIARGEIKDAIAIPNLGYFFDPLSKKRSETPGVKSKTVVGRDEQGRVFLGLSAKGRPFAKFIFGPGEFHQGLAGPDGKPLPASVVSELYAMSFANIIEGLVKAVLVTEHKSDEEIQAAREANKQARNGGGGGGYQNRNNGGGYNKGNGGGYNKGSNGGGYQNRNSGGYGGGSSEPSTGGFDGDDIPF